MRVHPLRYSHNYVTVPFLWSMFPLMFRISGLQGSGMGGHGRYNMRHALRRHLVAHAVALSIVASTGAVPAAATAPEAKEPTGVMSVIHRALQRRRTRLNTQVQQRAQVQEMSPQKLRAIHGRFFDRRDAQQRALDRARTSIRETKQPVTRQQRTRNTLTERHNRSVLHVRRRKLYPAEQLTTHTERRRRLREMRRVQLRRERDKAGLQRRTPQSRREKRVETVQKQKERMEERKQLREMRAEVAKNRAQYDKLRMAMLRAVNRERTAKNLPPLTYNKDLEMAAQLHAEDMLIRGYFNHFNPEGLSYVDRIRNIGYANVDMATCNCKAFTLAIRENIAKGQRSVNWAMNEWMASLPHRKNILSPHFKEIGIGIAEYIWVQNFGGIEYIPR